MHFNPGKWLDSKRHPSEWRWTQEGVVGKGGYTAKRRPRKMRTRRAKLIGFILHQINLAREWKPEARLTRTMRPDSFVGSSAEPLRTTPER